MKNINRKKHYNSRDIDAYIHRNKLKNKRLTLKLFFFKTRIMKPKIKYTLFSIGNNIHILCDCKFK